MEIWELLTPFTTLAIRIFSFKVVLAFCQEMNTNKTLIKIVKKLTMGNLLTLNS